MLSHFTVHLPALLRRVTTVLVLLTGAACCNHVYAQQKITFPSAEYANKFEMAKKPGKPVEIFGYLSMPSIPVSGKIPVVIIAHGSAGVEAKDTGFWAPYFNKLGFASFVVDSFTPRGVTSTVTDQELVSNAADTADAFFCVEIHCCRSTFRRR